MKIFIETEKWLMREVLEEDEQGFFELDSDPEVHKYLGNQPIKTMAEAADTVKYVQNQYHEYGIGRWAVIDKASNEFVGWSGLKYEKHVRENFDYYDLGYRLKKKFWGRGIATETAKASLNYGFQKLQLKDIYGGAHIENIASNKILKKVGLQFVETFDLDGDPHNWYHLKNPNL